MSDGNLCFNCAKLAHCKGCPRNKCKYFVKTQLTKNDVRLLLGVSCGKMDILLRTKGIDFLLDILKKNGHNITAEQLPSGYYHFYQRI